MPPRSRRYDAARRVAANRLARRLELPRARERAYERELLQEVARLRALVAPVLSEALDTYARARGRADSGPEQPPGGEGPPPPDPRPWLVRAIAAARAVVAGRWSPTVALDRVAEPIVSFALDGARAAVRARARDAADRIARIDVFAAPERAARIAEWTRQNVALVRSIPERMLGRLERIIQDEARPGTDVRELARIIERNFGVTEARARLIARDQTAKLNSAVQRHAMQSSGALAYVWRTSQDGRVRDEHAALDGQTFRWSDPPPAGPEGEPGHPGVWFQCRCVALPVYPEVDEAALDRRLADVLPRR